MSLYVTINKEGNKIRTYLRSLGASSIEFYDLCTNYGYTFKYGQSYFDLRHWLNSYGEDVNFWRLSGLDMSQSIQEDDLLDILNRFKEYTETLSKEV